MIRMILTSDLRHKRPLHNNFPGLEAWGKRVTNHCWFGEHHCFLSMSHPPGIRLQSSLLSEVSRRVRHTGAHGRAQRASTYS